MAQKTVDSKAYPLKELFLDKFDVDFYQREYVWKRKQLEDLINDLSTEFLKNWTKGDTPDKVRNYDPYFMGEIVLSLKEGERSAIIDGQQRITTFTLLLIYMLKTYEENNAKLYMVGVPIGNYDDMSYRAVETLKNVDIIFCEDTRVTLKLLTYFNISKPLKSYHTFNENEITDILINYIEEGKNVAVVSDAGMPIISDPGYVAVFEAIKRSIDVVVIPGPSAFVSALVGSGISSRKIYFVGFLNSNDNKRKKELEKLKDLEETLIMYESPHRIRETLEMISELMPTRNICLARELTKKYEEYLHGTASEILEVIDEIKGEIVLIIDGATTKEIKSDLISLSVQDHMNHYLEQGMDEKEAMKSVAKDRGVSKSIIYQQIKRK